jgi:type IV pilus biogenesis protein CpaD/CtpE
MAANPSDLLGERGPAGARDSARSALAIDQYRRGEVGKEEPKSPLRSTTKVTE